MFSVNSSFIKRKIYRDNEMEEKIWWILKKIFTNYQIFSYGLLVRNVGSVGGSYIFKPEKGGLIKY